MDLELRCHAVEIDYQKRLRVSTSTQKSDSSDKKKRSQFFNPVVAINNTEKVLEKRTCDNGEDVEHVIGKALQRVHVKFKST